MSSDSKKIIALGVLILGLTGVVIGAYVNKAANSNSDSSRHHEVETEALVPELNQTAENNVPANSPNSGSSGSANTMGTLPVPALETEELLNTPLSAEEVKSVKKLTGVLGKVFTVKINPKDKDKSNLADKFINIIRAEGLTPTKSVDSNEYTGDMTIIRTEDSLPGTRYLHIQMLGDQGKSETIQQTSFQIRPGKDSFQQAVAIMKAQLPSGSHIHREEPELIEWRTKQGLTARVHVMDMDDLNGSKYNASTKEDVGSINVVIEQEIHDEDHDH